MPKKTDIRSALQRFLVIAQQIHLEGGVLQSSKVLDLVRACDGCLNAVVPSGRVSTLAGHFDFSAPLIQVWHVLCNFNNLMDQEFDRMLSEFDVEVLGTHHGFEKRKPKNHHKGLRFLENTKNTILYGVSNVPGSSVHAVFVLAEGELYALVYHATSRQDFGWEGKLESTCSKHLFPLATSISGTQNDMFQQTWEDFVAGRNVRVANFSRPQAQLFAWALMDWKGNEASATAESQCPEPSLAQEFSVDSPSLEFALPLDLDFSVSGSLPSPLLLDGDFPSSFEDTSVETADDLTSLLLDPVWV